MRIFFDTEFLEDGHTIDLISIGLVREDGVELYLESAEADLDRAAEVPWMRENVLNRLTGIKTPRAKIAQQIIEFAGDQPEFWAYHGAYDWVVLCRLFGRMIDLPKGWPMFCRDIKQEAERLNVKLPEQQGRKHNALADARWNAACYKVITSPQRVRELAERMIYARVLPEQNERLELHEWIEPLSEAEARDIGVTFYNKEGYAKMADFLADEIRDGQIMLLERAINYANEKLGRRI